MTKLAISLIAGDLLQLRNEIDDACNVGVEIFHLDVIDGVAANNHGIPYDLIKRLRAAYPQVTLDVHLMICNPLVYFNRYAQICEQITIDLIPPHLFKSARQAADKSRVKLGVCWPCGIPLSDLEPYLLQVDHVLVMGVPCGQSGQEIDTGVCARLSRLSELKVQRGLGFEVVVDGGVKQFNASKLVASGANALVMGTGYFNHMDKAHLVDYMKSLN